MIAGMSRRSSRQSEAQAETDGKVTQARGGLRMGGHKLSFGQLESIIESFSIGVVAFDEDLRIIQTNSRADVLIEVCDHIDESLARGTDANVWDNWTELLRSVISTGQKREFRSVKYSIGSRTNILWGSSNIRCTFICRRHRGGQDKPAGSTGDLQAS